MALVASDEDTWKFIIYLHDFEVEVSLTGPSVIDDEFVHLVGTYDGTNLKFYVNGKLYHELDCDEEAVNQKRRDSLWKIHMIAKLNELEQLEITEEMNKARYAEQNRIRTTPSGQRNLTTEKKRLKAENVYRVKAQDAKVKALSRKGLDDEIEAMIKIKLLNDEQIEKKAEVNLMEIKASESRERVINKYIEKREKLEDDEKYRLSRTKTRTFEKPRIGSGCAHERSIHGYDFFVGKIQHVAIYKHMLSQSRINYHNYVITTNMEPIADKLFIEAAKLFQKSIEWIPNNRSVLHRYSEAICNHLVLDDRRVEDDLRYTKKIRAAIKKFSDSRNMTGIVMLVASLHAGEQYSFLACEALEVVRQYEPEYFKDSVDVLATFPDKFDLAQENNPKYKIIEAANIFKYILQNEPGYYNENVKLSWISQFETPELVTYIVRYFILYKITHTHTYKFKNS